MKEPTAEHAQKFWEQMSALHDTEIVVRPKLGKYKKLGKALQKFGVTDPLAYLDRFSFAVDRHIFVPFAPGGPEKKPWSQILTCVHEHEHVLDGRSWDLGPLARVGIYLAMRSVQAHWEMRAYRTAMELEWWRYGRIREDRPEKLAANLKSYWRMRPVDIKNVEASLRSSRRSIEQGAILGRATRSAIMILGRIAPEIRS